MATAKKTVKLHFPKNFMWGASISTHQVEGGNHNQWSTWELETAQVKVAQAPYMYKDLAIWDDIKDVAVKPSTYVSGVSTDHFNRYQTDFDIAKKLNLNVLRTGIEWSRIEPQEGEFNTLAIEHYRNYFVELKKRGITPVITLWHWTFPNWFNEKGGFTKRRNNKYFTRYIRYVTKELGVHFKYVITINEPTVYATMSYHEKRWPPEQGSKLTTFLVLLNLAAAHRKSYKIIKNHTSAKVGLAHNCAYFYAGDDSIISRAAATLAHKFSNEFFINRVKRTQDFFGLNFYFANRMIGTRVHNPNDPVNDLGWDMQPEKIGPLIEKLHAKYKLPFIVAENGLADMHDTHRKWWISQTVKAMDGVLQKGVPLVGYIHWSLLDNFEWAEGFWPRFGLVEIDYKTLARKIRPSAQWYARLIKTLGS